MARVPPWKRLLTHPRTKQGAILVGKAAAVSAAGVGGLALGLKEVKKSREADQAVDMWREASFDVRGRLPASAAATYDAILNKIQARGGPSKEEFQTAARRLRPVELHLEEATKNGTDKSDAAADSLIAKWRQGGYLENLVAPSSLGVFGRRLTSDAQGVDIGTLVPSSLCPADNVPSVRAAKWDGSSERAVQALQEWGCALVRGVVDSEDITKLRVAMGLGSGSDARRATEVGQWLLQRDPNVAMGRYTFGRLHCLLRGSPELEAPAVAAHAAVAPLVHAFFRSANAEGSRIFLSEAQLIVAEPMADAQGWHLDSVGSTGLSVFLPLTRIGPDRGQQAVLPGTHNLHDSTLPFKERFRRCFSALCATHGAQSIVPIPDPEAPILGPGAAWEAGDALVLDSRLLHRGLSNDGLGAPTAVLVLRYDQEATPPPGCARQWLLFMTKVGQGLDALFRLYAAV